MMRQIDTYFEVDFRGIDKEGKAFFRIYPETAFTEKQRDEIENTIENLQWECGFFADMKISAGIAGIYADFSNWGKGWHDGILENIIIELSHVTGIRKIIINDGSAVTDEEGAEQINMEQMEEFDWDEMLGLTGLSLNYTAHVAGIEGECFQYNIYFTDNTVDDEKVSAVSNAINTFDFNLIDDDYAGYCAVSEGENNSVSVYLDLGNVAQQNENKVIHGILLALNNVQGIEKVIINEDSY